MAGHEHELTDYSPAGVAARDALARAALAAVEAATPVDDREAAAKDAFLERTRLELELEDGRRRRARGCRCSQPPCTRCATSST